MQTNEISEIIYFDTHILQLGCKEQGLKWQPILRARLLQVNLRIIEN